MAKYLALFGIMLLLAWPVWASIDIEPRHPTDSAQVLSGLLATAPLPGRNQQTEKRDCAGERGIAISNAISLVPPVVVAMELLPYPRSSRECWPTLHRLHVRLQP